MSSLDYAASTDGCGSWVDGDQVNTFADLERLLQQQAANWRELTVDALRFWHRDEARLSLIGLAALVALLLAIRLALHDRRPRGTGLPALLRPFGVHHIACVRHAPLLLFLGGLPFALLAIADPYAALVQEETTFPGRRISLMIDASTSMSTSFKTEALKTRRQMGRPFIRRSRAAEQFVAAASERQTTAI